MRDSFWVYDNFIKKAPNRWNHNKQVYVWCCVCVFILFLTFFGGRVIFLQLVKGDEYRQRADNNRFFTRYISAPRGIFLDRNNTILVRNTPLYKVATEETKNTLHPQYIDVTQSQAFDAISNGESSVLIEQKREYVFGKSLAHVLGYTAEVNQEELNENKDFYIGQNIGKAGLEKTQEFRLMGTVGKDILETNAQGKVLQVVSHQDPVSGTNITLSIDASFSAKAYELLKERKGSVVASNPKTGEIYALVSSPSYDQEHIAEALTDKNLPLLNRVISGQYPPGSVFKMMTSFAALISQAIQKDTEVMDDGFVKVGEAIFRNWYFSQYGKTEGNVSIVKALQRSNDTFFYKVAELTGPQSIANTARLFQYGSKTGVELLQEKSGVIPDPDWKQKTLSERWYLGDTYHMGIGQGNVLVTPIQVNAATSAIANKGVWCKPHLLYDSKSECKDLGVSAEYINTVIEGMKAACTQGGTAYPFFSFLPQVACKTGTAEFGATDEKGRKKTHAWFTVFAPADNPTIALTVMLEGTEETQYLEGSSDAAPIAKELISYWLISHSK